MTDPRLALDADRDGQQLIGDYPVGACSRHAGGDPDSSRVALGILLSGRLRFP
jgi:hypothetical protein